jgi:hypothetical protein
MCQWSASSTVAGASFFSQELFEGRHIFSRFIWTVNGPDACHWEQAFSADGGKTWEINWTMTFTPGSDERHLTVR